MVLKYYFDLMSQPSRALYVFLKLSNIPFEASPIALRKGVHLTEDFKQKFNKFQRVPFVHDGTFRLAESVAIFRYLTRQYEVKDNWYPSDSRQRARIDEYLEWQHLNMRLHCTTYFRSKWLQPLITGKATDPKTLEAYKKNMMDTLQQFQELFLADGPYVNSQVISFADILAACEIEQLRLASYEARDNRPVLKDWLTRVQGECNPAYDEAHAVLHKMMESTRKKAQDKQ